MVTVRLLSAFRCHHLELAEGSMIGVPRETAERFVRLGVAEYAGPQTAVVAPEETRIETRKPGRPRKYAE